MTAEPKPKITNPIMVQILKKYVDADSVDGSKSARPEPSSGSTGQDWYNMTCPRCPWFIDGAETGQYVQVSGDAPGDAPDNAPVAGNDADGDAGRATGDSGRVAVDSDPRAAAMGQIIDELDARNAKNEAIMRRKTLREMQSASGPPQDDTSQDDTPWDEEWDELLDGVQVGAPGEEKRVPFVQCIRPESVECLNKSICVQLIVAGDLIRQQAAMQKMRGEMMGGPAPFVVGTEENRRRVVADARRKHNRPGRRGDRSRILIKAARKRGR